MKTAAILRRVRTTNLALVLAVAMLAVACSRASTTAAKTASSNPNVTLTVGFTEDQYVLSGAQASLGEYPLNANIVETLATITPDYKVVPALAESWTLIAPNTWRFKIRHGVKFHDGQALNAMAVKVGLFDRLAAMKGGSSLKAGPNSVSVVDESTLDFTPTVTNLRVPEQMVHPEYGVAATGSELGKKPVGTGPFRFVEYVPKERIVVERNPDYWGAKAKVAKITFRFYPDASTRRLALQSGEIDAAFEVPRDDVAGLKSNGFQILTSGVGAYDALLLNQHGKPGYDILTDVAVRQAVAMGIDRAKLVSGVLDGLATTDQTMVAPASLAPYTSTITGVTYDPAKAKSMLDAAGWVPGSGGHGRRRRRHVLGTGQPERRQPGLPAHPALLHRARIGDAVQLPEAVRAGRQVRSAPRPRPLRARPRQGPPDRGQLHERVHRRRRFRRRPGRRVPDLRVAQRHPGVRASPGVPPRPLGHGERLGVTVTATSARHNKCLKRGDP